MNDCLQLAPQQLAAAMLKVLTSRNLPSVLRAVTWPDPEHLCRLSELYRNSQNADAIRQDFSRVVSSIRVGGTWKLTSSDRLPEANRCLTEHVNFQPGTNVSVLDVGGSDGITTLELVQALKGHLNVDVNATLVDLYISLRRYDSRLLKEYRATNGSPVMVRCGRLGLKLDDIDQANPLRRILARWYLGRSFRSSMNAAQEISLVHPIAKACDSIRVMEGSVLDQALQPPNSSEIVRACNLLNRKYFSRDEMKSAIGNFYSFLKPDGYLLISRNQSQGGGIVECGSLWRKDVSTAGFQRIADFGNGCEIAELVDEFRGEAAGTR